MGPSVSPHGRKIQSQKNNIPNLSSAQLQMGGGEKKGRGGKIEEREGKMEIGWRWRGEWRGEGGVKERLMQPWLLTREKYTFQ